MMTNPSLAEALELHSSVVDDLLARAERVPEAAWFEPLAAGKWSPAEIVAQLN